MLINTYILRENSDNTTLYYEMPCVAPGIPTQTLFDPKENYPPGVLRSTTIQLPENGEFLDIQFFPECQEIVFAMNNRTSDTSSLRDERMRRWNCSRIDRAEDSWSLDEISSEKTKWKNGMLQIEWDRNKCQLLKDDIAKIEEMLKWQAEDLKNVCYENDVITHEIDEDIFELMVESGMVDDCGPFFEAEKEAKQSLNSSDEGCITDPTHIAAYDQWVSSQKQDIYQPSYFSDYAGYPEPVFWCPEEGLFGQGSDESDCKMLSPLLKDDKGGLVKFTPEMLEQRNHLNWHFNFHWNTTFFPGDTMTNVIPEQYGEVELVSVGEKHGIAKSPMGSVFVPRGVLKFLGSKAQVGQEFSASLEFVEGARYPWRVVKNSVQYQLKDKKHRET